MSFNGNGDRKRFDEIRSRLAGESPTVLSDEQLLTMLLGPGTRGLAADAVARGIVSSSGGARGLVDLSHQELCALEGVGPAKAAAIQAAIELGRRALAGVYPGSRLACSADVYDAMWPMMVREHSEVFACALLDAKLRLIRAELVSRGTLTASIVHPREAFRPAVRGAASGVIFAHNHPSGDPYPSDEDRRITARLEEVGRILGIPVLDHLILGTRGEYFSFADSGQLEPQTSGYRGMVLR
ncbi:MAG: DNA repair protein RadC [Actinobacteria bacterium]|nr:DNA repair protein RadC [Actinomycetota bacterium]MBU1943419.1 DNA repair protein RadC [Actinomycetota bacterium]MBU2686776.1 DNA repair protein RadC [Actinomycetota bacterium]